MLVINERLMKNVINKSSKLYLNRQIVTSVNPDFK